MKYWPIPVPIIIIWGGLWGGIMAKSFRRLIQSPMKL